LHYYLVVVEPVVIAGYLVGAMVIAFCLCAGGHIATDWRSAFDAKVIMLFYLWGAAKHRQEFEALRLGQLVG
jgi:hypothetical protein